jgi:hypothetical protein
MARFAGSRAPQIPNMGRSGDTPDFTPMSLSSGSVGTSAGSAQAADSWASIRENSPDWGAITSKGEEIKAEERIANTALEADMRNAGVGAVSNTVSARMQKEGMEAQAAAQEKAGMFSAIGGIASAAIGLSDETTKHTIERIEDACSILRQLNPVSFYYKDEYSMMPERKHYGFIAQEYKEHMPDATYFDESLGKLCIDTGELIGLLVRANQQLETRVTKLEAERSLATV